MLELGQNAGGYMLPYIKKSRKIAKQVSDINITTIFFLL
jgi:hypothetical protein